MCTGVMFASLCQILAMYHYGNELDRATMVAQENNGLSVVIFYVRTCIYMVVALVMIIQIYTAGSSSVIKSCTLCMYSCLYGLKLGYQI